MPPMRSAATQTSCQSQRVADHDSACGWVLMASKAVQRLGWTEGNAQIDVRWPKGVRLVLFATLPLDPQQLTRPGADIPIDIFKP
jgi:hypothetical protein